MAVVSSVLFASSFAVTFTVCPDCQRFPPTASKRSVVWLPALLVSVSTVKSPKGVSVTVTPSGSSSGCEVSATV